MQYPSIWIAAAAAVVALGLTSDANANDRHERGGRGMSQEMMDQDSRPRAGAPDMMDMMRKMERMMRRMNRMMHAMGADADEDDERGQRMGHGAAADRGGGAQAMMGVTGRHPDAARVGPRFGTRVTRIEHLSVADVRHFLDHHLGVGGNKRLRVGAVEAADDATTTAVIETVEGSLVQRFSVDRHTGRLTKTE